MEHQQGGPVTIRVDSEPEDRKVEQLRANLRSFNQACIGPYDAHHLLVTAKSLNGEMIGGIHGYIQFSWLHVHLLWVAPAWRRQGIGSRLLSGIEKKAQSMGISRSRLSTADFQDGLHLYTKHGYTIFATLPFSSTGGEDQHIEYLMQKQFS